MLFTAVVCTHHLCSHHLRTPAVACLLPGVHFQQSIDASKKLCPDIGIDGYNKYLSLRAGTA
jgi:hypothetical protein